MAITHIYFLLDRSGSMASMAPDVIGGFNHFLGEQQADGDDALMTLVQFDSQDPFEVLVDAKPLDRVRGLSARTFQPRGGTPLLDATGRLISHATARADRLAGLSDPAEDILVVTFTDGEENQSQLFDRAAITAAVKAKEAAGWTFAFLGAGLDAYAEAGAIGVDARSTQAFAADGTGASMAFSSLSRATSSHRAKLRRGAQFDKGDFFEGAKEAEDDRKGRPTP